MANQLLGRPVEILVVEDNPGDARLTKEAFDQGAVDCNLHLVQDGTDAIAFLRRSGEHAAAPRPDIILLDLNLPGKDGREVLREIKADPSFRRIPVVVLTTSTSDDDIVRTYDNHANCYVSKPVELDEFMNVVKAIELFWLTVVILPPE